MIRVTIDRVVVEGLSLTEREVRERLEAAFGAPRLGLSIVALDEREIERIVREAFGG